MSTRISMCIVFACLACAGIERETFAQGTTSTGVFGNRTVGGGQGVTAGNRNAFGGQNPGALESTQAGSRIDQLIGSGTAGGTVDGSERYLRGNRDASQFVGVGAETFVGQVTAGAGGGTGQFGGGLGLGNMRNNNNRQNAGRQPFQNNGARSQRNIIVRTKLSIGFRYRELPENAIQANVRKYLNSSDSIGRLGTIQVDLADRTATLRGSVATEQDRALAVRLARLEPGVSRVVDELIVLDVESDPVSPSDPQS